MISGQDKKDNKNQVVATRNSFVMPVRSQHSPGKEEGRDDSNDKYSEYDLKYEHYYNNL